LAVALTPFLARDLDEWIRSWPWPAWTRPPAVRAGLASVACLVLTAVGGLAPPFQPGVGLEWPNYPVAACDYMSANGVRGRGFNPFPLGGYLLWRFWPERDRLPFMDVHATGTRADRDLMSSVLGYVEAWRELDRRHRFEWVLMPAVQLPGQRLLDDLDTDS